MTVTWVYTQHSILLQAASAAAPVIMVRGTNTLLRLYQPGRSEVHAGSPNSLTGAAVTDVTGADVETVSLEGVVVGSEEGKLVGEGESLGLEEKDNVGLLLGMLLGEDDILGLCETVGE